MGEQDTWARLRWTEPLALIFDDVIHSDIRERFAGIFPRNFGDMLAILKDFNYY